MLLLDCGNTRMKWRHVTDRDIVSGALVHAEQPLLSAPIWSALQPDEHVYVSNVSDHAHRVELQRLIKDATGREAHYAQAEPMQSGLLNGYRDYHKLGVDRWLAMLAAWRECHSRCIVIDAGTAITVDLIDEQGKHEGGHIVPGLQLLMNTLLAQTANVKFTPARQLSIAPGRDTAAAVSGGSLAMAVGYLRYLLQDAWSSAPASAVVFVTGGDAELLSGQLQMPVNVRENLVLDGLSLYANEHP